MNVRQKVCDLGELDSRLAEHRQAGRRIVLCHGCFDIVHPGHLRYLEFACSQGDVLVVTLTDDQSIEKSDGTRPYIPQELRAETLSALQFVDLVAVVADPTAEPAIRAVRPDVYVKGKEYEHSTHPGFLAEKQLVEKQGGCVVTHSGDVVFSSTAILSQRREHLAREGMDEAAKLATCCQRWGISELTTSNLLAQMRVPRRVAVVGDLLMDHYVMCDATQVSHEGPFMSVRPLDKAHYVGGAGVISMHLAGLGAKVDLLTSVGRDRDTAQAMETLEQAGVSVRGMPIRASLPRKMRYIVGDQKLLKVDEAQAVPLDSQLQRQLVESLAGDRQHYDAVVFADFRCGVVSDQLVELIRESCAQDVQFFGSVSGVRRSLLGMRRFDGLFTTERELRGVMGDFESSLPAVAIGLMRQAMVGNLFVTLGDRGCVQFAPREDDPVDWFQSRLRSDYLPALAGRVTDTLGAGDAFLSAAVMARLCGEDRMMAAYLGSAAAALEVSHTGNVPISADDVRQFVGCRPELAAA